MSIKIRERQSDTHFYDRNCYLRCLQLTKKKKKKKVMVQIIYFMNSSVNAIKDFANACPAKCPLQMLIMNSRQNYERQVVTS